MGITFEEIAKDCLKAFKEIAEIETTRLKTESMGVPLLHAIGYTYTSKADYYLSKIEIESGSVFQKVWGYGSAFSLGMKEKAHLVSDVYGTIKTAASLQSTFTKLQDLEKKKEKADAELTEKELQERQKLEHEAAVKGMEALWKGTKFEVESVLREVCDRVLGDANVDIEIRRRRAVALQVLGQVYQSVQGDTSTPDFLNFVPN
jgi:hypothetical protein